MESTTAQVPPPVDAAAAKRLKVEAMVKAALEARAVADAAVARRTKARKQMLDKTKFGTHTNITCESRLQNTHTRAARARACIDCN